MIEIAETKSERDYLILCLMRYGLRVGEITGERGLPGIHTDHLRFDTNTIWVKGKGYARGIVQDREIPFPLELMNRIRAYTLTVNTRKDTRVFQVSARTMETRVQEYAHAAGIEDWERIGPHRLRAFFATDAKDKGLGAFEIRDLMRHKNITTTNLYVGQSSPEQLAKLLEKIG